LEIIMINNVVVYDASVPSFETVPQVRAP